MGYHCFWKHPYRGWNPTHLRGDDNTPSYYIRIHIKQPVWSKVRLFLFFFVAQFVSQIPIFFFASQDAGYRQLVQKRSQAISAFHDWKVGFHIATSEGSLSNLLHPRKLTWIPKMMVWKRWLLYYMAIFGISVKFLGCITYKLSTFSTTWCRDHKNPRSYTNPKSWRFGSDDFPFPRRWFWGSMLIF